VRSEPRSRKVVSGLSNCFSKFILELPETQIAHGIIVEITRRKHRWWDIVAVEDPHGYVSRVDGACDVRDARSQKGLNVLHQDSGQVSQRTNTFGVPGRH
jgi:hypothetical protein